MSRGDNGAPGQGGPVEPGARWASALPDGLTSAGVDAYRDVFETASGALLAQLRLRRRLRRDLTDADVYEAWEIVTGGVAAPAPRSGPGSTLGAGLIAIGSVGVGSMHPYLHSSWQIALFVLVAAIGVVGVGLTLRAGRSVAVSAQPIG